MKRFPMLGSLLLAIVILCVIVSGCSAPALPNASPAATSAAKSRSEPPAFSSVAPSTSIQQPVSAAPYTATLGEEFFVFFARRLRDHPLYRQQGEVEIQKFRDFASPQELHFMLYPEEGQSWLLSTVWLIMDLEAYALEAGQPTPFNLEQYRCEEGSIPTVLPNAFLIPSVKYAFPAETLGDAFAAWFGIEEGYDVRPLWEGLGENQSDFFYDKDSDTLFYQVIGAPGMGDMIQIGAIELSYAQDGVVSAVVELVYWPPEQEQPSATGSATINVRQFPDGRICLLSVLGFDDWLNSLPAM